MSNDVKVSKFSLIVNFVVLLTPFIFIICGAYFGYFGFYMRNKFNKTFEDIQTIDKNIKQNHTGIYKNFDTQYVVLSNFLPYDLEVKNSASKTPLIKNRFGGNMFFYEALNSEAERTLYYGLISEPQKYKSIYTGVSAYIILLTGLSSYECQKLATHDWAKIMPNYIGIEVSSLEYNQIYNGFTKLKTSFIPDSENDALYHNSIKDKGYISVRPLSDARAKEKCNCKSDNCTFAIKLK